MAGSPRLARLSADGSSLLEELRAALDRGCGSQQPIEGLRQRGLVGEGLLLLREALREPEPRTRAEACLALDYLDDRAAAADLQPMLSDPDEMVAVRAADALCRFGEPAAVLVPRLSEILRQRENVLPIGRERVEPPCMMLQMPEVRFHAARILGYLGAEAAPAREELRAAMASASAMVRAEAAKALAGIGEAPAVYLTPLRQALHDSHVQSSRERVWAAETLVELGEPSESVIAVLAELVGDEDYTAASWAICFLGKLGRGAESAIPALRAVRAAGRNGISEEAAAAIQRIGLPSTSDGHPAEQDAAADDGA